jgi:WD repeat-containing protein 19
LRKQIFEIHHHHQAFDLVRTTSSTQGAILVSEYCNENNDYRSAIEFLLIAGKSDDAFKLAQTHSLVEVYATFLGDAISSDDALKVAHHYEKTQELGKAGILSLSLLLLLLSSLSSLS